MILRNPLAPYILRNLERFESSIKIHFLFAKLLQILTIFEEEVQARKANFFFFFWGGGGHYLGSTHLHTPNWHFPLTRHSETFPFSYMKFLSTESKYLEFLRKKIGKGLSRTRTRSVASAVHLPYHYATENLLTIDGLIWRYIATTLTPNRS